MKFSQFNTCQPFQDKMLVYNAYSDKYLLIEPILFDILESAKANKDTESIKEIHPQFYDALVGNGVIIANEDNEIEKVRNLMEEINNGEEVYRLIVNPTMNCNFKCWYCYETHVKDSKMEEDTVDKVCKFISNILKNKKDLKLLLVSFFGGEPLLYYQKVVVPVLKYATALCGEYGVAFTGDFTTNGFLITPQMVSEFRGLSVNSFQITLDGSQEDHDKVRFVSKTRGSYFDIIRNVLLLAENRFNVTLRLNYTTDNLVKMEDILNDLEALSTEYRRHINISLHQVWQDGNRDLGLKVKNLMAVIRQLGFSTGHSILADTVRNSCYADKKNHATINYNGEVFKCTARDFTTANREGVLNKNGEIEWNEKYTARITSRLKNAPCLECAILPICGGGCSQKAMENENKEYCVNFFDENRKKTLVMDRFIGIAEDIMATA